MDVMGLRRRMMTLMAQGGADFVKGTFTVPDNQSSPFYFNFGKTFEKYLFLIDMTDESKEELMETTGISGPRCYTAVGMYPLVQFDEVTDQQDAISHTYAPTTGSVNRTANAFNQFGSESQLGISCGALSVNASNRVYQGLSYNYYIVEIK